MSASLAPFDPRAPLRLVTGMPEPMISAMGWWGIAAGACALVVVGFALAARVRERRLRHDAGFGVMARRMGMARSEARSLLRAAKRSDVPPVALLLSDAARARFAPTGCAVGSANAPGRH